MAAKKKNWIKGAIKHPGRLTKAAEASGVSKLQKATEWSHSSDASKRAAGNLGKRFIKGKLHAGGPVPTSGLYELEEGEEVIPKYLSEPLKKEKMSDKSVMTGQRLHGVQPSPREDVKAYPTAEGPACSGPGHYEVDGHSVKFVGE